MGDNKVDTKDPSNSHDLIDMPFEEFRKYYMNSDVDADLSSKMESGETKNYCTVDDDDNENSIVTKVIPSSVTLDSSLEELRKQYRRLTQPIPVSASETSVNSAKSATIEHFVSQNSRFPI